MDLGKPETTCLFKMTSTGVEEGLHYGKILHMCDYLISRIMHLCLIISGEKNVSLITVFKSWQT